MNINISIDATILIAPMPVPFNPTGDRRITEEGDHRMTEEGNSRNTQELTDEPA